jgi:ferrous iron transport protein A
MRLFGWTPKEPIKPDNPNIRNSLYLDTAVVGQSYTMLGLEGGSRFREKIYSMGLNPGVKFVIVQNSGHGPIEIEVRRSKLAIGRGMASRIKVRLNGAAG